MMKVIGIQSSPNIDGLTSMLVKAVLEGAKSKGAKTELLHLNKLDIKSCEAHNLDGRGWGTCSTNGTCMIKDDFKKLRSIIKKSDALVFGTPVYFGDISESAKNFLDRWRRCKQDSPGKPAVAIAAAGGSGGGAANALHNLEIYLRHLQFTMFDLVPITQKSKKHKLDMLRIVGQRLVSE